MTLEKMLSELEEKRKHLTSALSLAHSKTYDIMDFVDKLNLDQGDKDSIESFVGNIHDIISEIRGVLEC